jgi:hypothetical protein
MLTVNMLQLPAEMAPEVQLLERKRRKCKMLRIDLLGTATVRISGRLAEGCREEVESFLDSHPALPGTIVDLSEITYIDSAGEEVLCWLGQRGARFAANSTYAVHVCERLHLNMAELPAAASRLTERPTRSTT